MQPSWRKNVNIGHETPRGESWDTLRKGGTAGIYVVVMGLSWWIKAQGVERDAEAWLAVDDVSWVIEEMKKPAKLVSAKRMHDGAEADEDEGHKRK